MSSFTCKFYGVGDRVVDTLVAYALSDLARRVDLRVTFEWSLGHDVILTLHSSHQDIQNEMLETLRSGSRSVTLANRLNYWLNTGSSWIVDPATCLYCAGKKGKKPCNMSGNCGFINIPAYPIFCRNLDKVKMIDWTETQLLSKHKKHDYETLYVGLSPYWSKGIRTWDSKWDGYSTYLPTQLQVLLLYGLAYYAITISAETFIILLFLPPFGAYLEHADAQRILELIKRIVNRFSLEVRRIRISELPLKTVPLALLSQMDLPSIVGLSRERLSLLFVAYDLDRGVPKNPRGYEEWSLTEVADFYSNLGEHFWDFKSMIEDLASQIWRDEFRTRIQSILVDISYAISGRNVWLLNDALLKTKGLSDELRIHLPTRDAVLVAQQLLKGI